MILAETSIQLVPDGTLLLHLLMVGVMVFVLNRTLLRPINQILAEREKQIAGRLKEAEAMAAETQEKLKKYNDALRAARADGYKLLEKERAQGLKEKEEKLRRYREDVSREVASQIETTRKQEQAVKRELDEQAATIGDLISSQILRRR
ncbi:MAG TPA: ATP synthase F0 subunit B [Pyrinomonadaceae bacterium]|jgi:F0F1-type ATP synthase membrane subunit b/b'|nr:ATP synthase F0 subunit B [Pyrinomonadaceae bacterium]